MFFFSWIGSVAVAGARVLYVVAPDWGHQTNLVLGTFHLRIFLSQWMKS